MSDTPPDVREKFRALLMALPEGDRAMMAVEMFDRARALMAEDIRATHPGIPDNELRVKIFERTYGSEFSGADRARITQEIRSSRSARRADWD